MLSVRSPARRWIGVLAATAALAGGCRYTSDLRLPDQQAVSSQVLWADGSLLTTLHTEKDREPVPLAGVASSLPTAVVAIEDERFFEHDGVDARGVLRALTHDVQKGDVVEGGSTITQQYVRAVMLGRERDLERKLREAVMAVQLEQRYSKKTILERYLNTIYLGNGAYGVQAASRLYFGKNAKDLDLAQSAMLAGVIRAPESYNPFTHPDLALARRNEVLDRLATLGRAPADQLDAARATPLGLDPHRDTGRSPAGHFVEQVRRFILGNAEFGVTEDQRRRLLLEGGLRIHTTLDPKWQVLAEQAIQKVISRPATDPAAALVALDPVTGAVRAYVGGADFFGPASNAKFDLAGQGRRQAGSTFKPFVLATALEAGLPLRRTYNAPASITIPLPGQKPWLVNNYDGNGSGRLDLTEATVKSVNTVYAQLIMDLGPQPVVDLAARLGVHSPLQAVPSAALGTNGVTVLDMASGYSSLAGDGLHTDPIFVTRVTRRDGTVLYDAPTARQRVLPETTARTVTQVLQQVVERGTGINARIGRPVAGKTGTGEEWQDAWFVGYTPQLVAAVWVGFPDAERTMRPPTTRITVTGGSWPAQIWQLFAGAALAETPASSFPPPARPTAAASSTTTAPSRAPVFSVVGMNALAAARTLRDAGYTVHLATRPSREYPPGTVIGQDPPAGRTVKPGGTVTITVASGSPRAVAVPSGLGAYADEAAATMRAAGFDVNVVPQPEPPPGSATRAGRVWKQSPVAGSSADQGTTVTMWVNPG